MTTETTAAETTTKKRNTRRRGNGEGSIFLRADGYWVGTINIGYNEAGKRRRKTVYGETKKAVQEAMARLQSRKLDGTLGDAGRLTVGEFLTHWLENSAKPTIRATTHASYQSVIKLHIKPRLGGLALSKLAPAHVQGLYSEMERTGASPRLRQLTHAILRRAVNQAVKWGAIPRNVCDAVDPPRVARKEIHALTAEQAKALLKAAADDRLGAIYTLAITTGLRLGELFGLQWADVDLAAGSGSLCVRHTLMEMNGKLSLSEPKTAKSRRKVELSAMAVAALWDHRRKMLAAGHGFEGHVFRDSRGGPLRRSHFTADTFKPLLKRAGLPDIRFHDLRHTAATLMLSGGEHPKVVQEMLGHSNISMTMDTYSHVLPTMQRAAVDRLGDLLKVSAG